MGNEHKTASTRITVYQLFYYTVLRVYIENFFCSTSVAQNKSRHETRRRSFYLVLKLN
jgi:hypothetical protein